jgi:hypothetical protein
MTVIVSRAKLGVAIDPNISKFIRATAWNSASAAINTVRLARISATSPVVVTNSSTGTAGSVLSAVPSQAAKVTPSGTNLAPRAGFNTAIGKINNAIAVLAGHLNDMGLTPLGLTTITGGNGTVATPSTVPALDKTLTGVDGSSDSALLRSEFLTQLVIARNNLATLVSAYNTVAVAIGQPTLANVTGGKASPKLILTNQGTAGTAVLTANVSSSDLASDAAVDAALTALANNIATLSEKVDDVLFAAGSVTAVEPIVLVP